MDFTELYKQNLVDFSPDSRFILSAFQHRLVLRNTSTFSIYQTWQIDASPSPTRALVSSTKEKDGATTVSHIGWSRDSEYILAAVAKQGVVHVYKVQDVGWSARIESGTEGLVKAEWAPDGRTILCFSQWGLRVTIWTLSTGLGTYIQYPLHPDAGYAFRSDGRYFVLAERHKSKDTLGVYDTEDAYKLVRHFPSPTASLASLALSPTGNYIAVWEGPIEYKLHILSLAGNIQGSFCPDPDPGYGIRRVGWHPTGMFLAVGGWDEKVGLTLNETTLISSKIHILDLTWTVSAVLELSSRIPSNVNIWREPSKWQETTEGRGFLSYERVQGPHSISINRHDATKAAPKSGVAQLEWNKNGSLLLVRFDNCPNVLHLYDFPTVEQEFRPRLRSVLLHSRPILHARWNPVRNGSLAICCGSQALYMWSDEWMGDHGEEEMAECIGVPAKTFATRDLRWAGDGKGVVLVDKEVFCSAFEVEDE
ncbi:ATP-dependent metallopeptidase [Mycena kentingensis (nom. inval.)]|nr:ATP-dependent metallopeptidase [Mycena kentingensis (nom. inval.)]